jgi:hypothetical protein
MCRGRKKAALTYVVTYTLGCATKHWNMFVVLLVGRLFCGVATSLLYSAFESWLVAEHFKVKYQPFLLVQACVSPRVRSPLVQGVYTSFCFKVRSNTKHSAQRRSFTLPASVFRDVIFH